MLPDDLKNYGAGSEVGGALLGAAAAVVVVVLIVVDTARRLGWL